MTGKIKFKDTDMQAIIGWVLRIGVIVSVSIVFFGAIVFLIRHGSEVAGHTKFNGVPSFVQLNHVIQGVLDFRAQSIIQVGIILLIATPIVRVLFSAIGFLLEKDYLYVAISLLVFLIILISMISGHGG